MKEQNDECIHIWRNDPLFEDGAVVLMTNIDHSLGEEMRQYCQLCDSVRYVTK